MYFMSQYFLYVYINMYIFLFFIFIFFYFDHYGREKVLWPCL